LLTKAAMTTERAESYNPLFLPKKVDLVPMIEFDGEGDIAKIDGFQNPFISAQFKHSLPDHPDVVNANVCYHPFELPPLHEIFDAKPVRLS
jgi:hypothetical protein